MSKHRPKLSRELLFPIGMLVVLTGVIIWKQGHLESFDWLVIIVLAVMLIARVIEWVYKFYNKPANESTDQERMDDKD
jgi:hypothetical protein